MEENSPFLKSDRDGLTLSTDIHVHHGLSSKFSNASSSGHVPSSPSSSIDSVLIAIGDPEPSPPKFPKEPKKLLISVVFLCVAAFTNDTVLAWIHERVPETAPLPDLFFAHTFYYPNALVFSEYLLLTCCFTMMIICFLHKHRWIVFRRVFFMVALLYLGRSVCMLVTQLPVADPSYHCSPKLNHTGFRIVASRTLQLVSGAGLIINGKHSFCGDYIYSGHTLVLVMSYLVIKEYSPRRYWLFHWVIWLAAIAGVICLLLSRGHYTVDVIIAYYITTRIFWLYHTLADHSFLKEPTAINLMSRECWFMFFRYMERNVGAPVPRQFEWPLPWPRFILRPTLRNNRYTH